MRVTTEWLAAYEAKQAAKSGQPVQAPKQSKAVEQEADLHDQIQEACIAQGWLYFHGRMDKASARTLGEPDFTILCGDSQVLFIEAKAKSGKLSGDQVRVIAHAAKMGVTIHVVRSIEEFWQVVNLTKNKGTA